MPGPPSAPGSGQTAYQSAQYARKLTAWRAKRAAEVRAEAAKTGEQVSAWLSGLQIPAKIRQLADPPADEGSLAAESAVAASAQAGLEEGAGDVFGSRRVIVLFCGQPSGALPAGELTGDDAIVVTSYLPTAAEVSAAQAALLGAGAAQAAVIGPEVTAAQLAALVSAGLSQGTGTGDSVSAPVLFGNGSYALEPAATFVLTGLLPRLRQPGATAVISGFASTPGTAEGQLHAVLPASGNSRAIFRINRNKGVVADHRGAWGDRSGWFGGLGGEPASTGGDRGAARLIAAPVAVSPGQTA